MKKIPFYNPASPFFFHVAVVLLYILIFLRLLSLSIFFTVSFTILIFTAAYSFFALVMVILVRRVYINTFQTPVPEEFVDKLALYNRYLITVIYIFSFIAGFLEANKEPETELLSFFLLFSSGLCFLFYLFILPIIIRLILLKKINLILEIIILGIFFFYFFWAHI